MSPIKYSAELGSKYSFLTVVSTEAVRRENRRKLLFRCDCGVEKYISIRSVLIGETRSCGCYMHGNPTLRPKKPKKQQMPEKNIWWNLKGRCLNPNNLAYARYGGAGITVCQRWMKFENFLEDMGPRPHPSLSIDRIDNSRGYEPNNCRWASDVTQSRNRRHVKQLTVSGETKSLPEWAETKNIKYKKLAGRLRRGWTLEAALEAGA